MTDTPFDRAQAHHRAGRLAEAETDYRAALAADPRHAAAHLNLGLVLRGQGKADAALASLEQAVALDPTPAAALFALGNLHREQGRLEPALAAYDQAATRAPDDARTHHNRAFVLAALDRLDEALAAFARALALSPDDPDILSNRGAALFRAERFEPALADFDRVLALRPNEARSHFNRARALDAVGRHGEALAGHDRALGLQPDLTVAGWERARLRLKLGDWAGGWADYERRWADPTFRRTSSGEVTDALRARFDPTVGVEALQGRRVLVVGEQGVGDVIMFASVLPDLAAVAARVTLLCEPRLQRLFRASFPGLDVVDPSRAPPDADHVLAIGSLGRLFRRRAADFPGTPYLSAPPQVRDGWAERLGPRQARLRVGLSWRGGLRHTGRSARSIPLAQLAPLLQRGDCEFVSLQYGDPRAEIADVNATLARPIRAFDPAAISDFDDLAGLVQTLDVVVSVQTALVHLAGGLGARTLVMVPANPEWRYGVEGATTPWYGSVELIRQPTPGNWDPVIKEVERLLSPPHHGEGQAR